MQNPFTDPRPRGYFVGALVLVLVGALIGLGVSASLNASRAPLGAVDAVVASTSSLTGGAGESLPLSLAALYHHFMLKDGVRDTGCSLKLFRREDFVSLPFFTHLHRYIPALMLARGASLGEVGSPKLLSCELFGSFGGQVSALRRPGAVDGA